MIYQVKCQIKMTVYNVKHCIMNTILISSNTIKNNRIMAEENIFLYWKKIKIHHTKISSTQNLWAGSLS